MSIQTIDQRVKEIKLGFRQLMDGATAQSMRQKGIGYHLNWGVTIPRLRQMSDEIKENSEDASLYSLSVALWKENVRECKILATMLMPPEVMPPEVVDIWMEQTPTLEIAEQSAFNLYQHLPYAADKAFEWLASPEDLPQICGYHVLSRLFMRGQEPNERGINEFLDQAMTALQSSSSPAVAEDSRVSPSYAAALRKAAMQAVVHFADISIMHQRLAKTATRRIGLSFL